MTSSAFLPAQWSQDLPQTLSVGWFLGMAGGRWGDEGGASPPAQDSLPSPGPCLQPGRGRCRAPASTGDPKPPCLPRNGLVKLPGQPNGLRRSQHPPRARQHQNRPCQPPPPTSTTQPGCPTARAALAGGLCPQAGLPLVRPALAPVPGPPAERPPWPTDEKDPQWPLLVLLGLREVCASSGVQGLERVLYQPKFWAGLTPVRRQGALPSAAWR